MSLLMLFTVAGTAMIAAMEASKVGMKFDKKKGTYNSISWFILIIMLWVICYPAYLCKRKYYGLTSRLLAGIVIVFVFTISWANVSYHIEEKYSKGVIDFGTNSWANQGMQNIHDQVAEDAVKQYKIAERQGDPIQICVQAGLVSAAYLQAKDEKNYQKWKKIESEACRRAGLPQ